MNTQLGLALKLITNLLGICQWNFPFIQISQSPPWEQCTLRTGQTDWIKVFGKRTCSQNDKQSNRHKMWRRDYSFEGIMYSHGHNSWETQTKTTFFVMHYLRLVCQLLKEDEPRLMYTLKALLLPPQGFGPEAKTRGGTLGFPACIHIRNFKI